MSKPYHQMLVLWILSVFEEMNVSSTLHFSNHLDSRQTAFTKVISKKERKVICSVSLVCLLLASMRRSKCPPLSYFVRLGEGSFSDQKNPPNGKLNPLSLVVLIKLHIPNLFHRHDGQHQSR